MLQFLVERHGQLVSRGELLESVWDDAIVTDSAVTQSLKDVRRAIGDSDQSRIRTVPRRGYVFEMPVELIDGYDPHVDVSRAAAKPVRSSVALASILVLTISGLAIWQLADRSEVARPVVPVNGPARQSPSIAVLPFVDMSPSGDKAYLADGIAAEILSTLHQVPGLTVIARTSSFSFRGQDATVAEIAAALNVSHILEGSLRSVDDQLRVHVQLIDAETSEQLWSKPFDGAIGEIFELQAEISEAVAGRLELGLPGRASRISHTSPEAYSLYLQAVHLLGNISQENNARAEAYLEESLSIDPNSAPAWREIARARWQFMDSDSPARVDAEFVKHALDRSMEIDPTDPATLTYYGASIADFGGDIERAARLFERAIATDPINEHVMRAGILFITNYGNPVDAVAFGEYGLPRNPVCLLCAYNLWYAYLWGRELDKAEALARRVVDIHDDGHDMVGKTLLLRGRPAEAIAWFEDEESEVNAVAGQAMALHDLGRLDESKAFLDSLSDESRFGLSGFAHIEAYAWTGRHDAAFDAFDTVNRSMQYYGGEIIVRQRPWPIPIFARSQFLRPLHDDPRWAQLEAELGISDAQLRKVNFQLSLPDAR